MHGKGYHISIKALPAVFLLLLTVNGFAQGIKSQLQEEKKKLEEEIKYTTRLLNETKKNKQVSISQLVMLKKKIRDREKLIGNINEQIRNVDQMIENKSRQVENLSRDLKSLKEEYAKMIYYAYKNKSSYDRLIFIFSSKDFNQAFRRLKYFQQYSTYRKTQAELINKTQADLSRAIRNLEDSKSEKLVLLQDKETEKKNLVNEKDEQNDTYNNLTKREKELVKTIREKQQAASRLEKEIERIISEEIALSAGKKGTRKTGSFSLTPEEVLLSGNFEQNKGLLPWPAERGIVSGTFGEHEHPVLKGVKTKNNGVDISSEKGSAVRAVFNGTVTRVVSIPNYNYVVMIRHGEYLSVYSNMSEVSVSKGDAVTTKQKIGVIHTDVKDAKTELHFELWKGKTLLNPSEWLSGMK